VIGFGPLGSIRKFSSNGGYASTVVVVGNGIVDTIQEWGKVVNDYGYPDARDGDFSINYLGYALCLNCPSWIRVRTIHGNRSNPAP
jgi:hypothetical protein